MELALQHNLPAVSDSLTRYLAEIRRFPLLSEEEETEYANRLHRQNDIEAAHRLVTSNLRFVVKIAGEYRNYGLRMLDLIQEGNVGLMLAVRKFNPNKGVRLISYAVWWIRAQIHDFIMSSWSLIKIGTTQAQKKLFFKLRQTREALERLDDGDVTSLVATETGVGVAEVDEMSIRMQGDVSIDAEIVDGAGLTLAGTLEDSRPDQETLLIEHQEESNLRGAVQSALAALTDRERYIVEHMMLSENPVTLQDVGDRFSISRERARQIKESALLKVKKMLLPYSEPAA